MDREEALKLLRGGKVGVETWNRLNLGENSPSLWKARLENAQLSGCNLRKADLYYANLTLADLSQANLGGANLKHSNLSKADFSRADISGADLTGADLQEAKFSQIRVGWTNFAFVDLSAVQGLNEVIHGGPSTIGTNTLFESNGKIPEKFLRGCGFQSWEIEQAKLYNPDLTPTEINEIYYKAFELRTRGPLFIGGAFISYSHDNSDFVDKLYDRLRLEGVPTWLDKHELVAGPLQKQIFEAMRNTDVVVLVLSEESIESDWVENELEMARLKEKDEKREVLCPISLDDSWRKKMEMNTSSRALWRKVFDDKVIVDFSQWESEKFDEQFRRLLKGMKIYYEPRRDK